MPKTALLDSSVWVAYFSEEDFFHKKAQRIIDNLSRKNITIFIPDLVYIEVLNTLKRKMLLSKAKLNAARKFLKNYPLNKLIYRNYYFENEENKLFTHLKSNLKSPDLLIFIHYLGLHADEFFTFDNKLKKYYKLNV